MENEIIYRIRFANTRGEMLVFEETKDIARARNIANALKNNDYCSEVWIESFRMQYLDKEVVK